MCVVSLVAPCCASGRPILQARCLHACDADARERAMAPPHRTATRSFSDYADSDSDSDDDEGERTHRRARLRRKVWDPFGGMKVSRRFEAPRPPAMVHACR